MHDTHRTAEQRRAWLERLRTPVLTASLTLEEVRQLSAWRVLALCGPACREPLVELAPRMGSLTAAKAFIGFAERVARYWPEPVRVARPCCRVLTPDEATIAALVRHAAAGDRPGFGDVLDGFVRAERHAPLYDSCVAAIGGADVDLDRA